VYKALCLKGLVAVLQREKIPPAGLKGYGGHTYRMLRRTITCQCLSTMYKVSPIGVTRFGGVRTDIRVKRSWSLCLDGATFPPRLVILLGGTCL
jgi:hypothetical protein